LIFTESLVLAVLAVFINSNVSFVNKWFLWVRSL